MLPFSNFRITDRQSRRGYHRLQLLALLPLGVALLLMGTSARWTSPSLWGSVGLVLGAQMMLAGGYHLHSTSDRLTPWGRRLASNINTWFPYLAFFVQNVCMGVVFLLLWLGTQFVGLPVNLWQSVNFLALLLVIPLRRVLSELAEALGSLRLEHLAHAVTLLLTALAATFLAGALAVVFTASGEEAVEAPTLVIWVPTGLLVLTCLLLAIRSLGQALFPAEE